MWSFHFYHHYFHIQYNYYSRNYHFRYLIIVIFFFKNCLNISNHLQLTYINFFFFNFLLSFFSSSISKSIQISLIKLSLICLFLFFNIKGFLTLFCVFGLLSFYSLPSTIFFRPAWIKRFTIHLWNHLNIFL